MKEKITKNMFLGDVVGKHPKTIEVFMKYGLPCAMCGVAFSETVEQGASSHGIDLKSLLKDLNKVATKKMIGKNQNIKKALNNYTIMMIL